MRCGRAPLGRVHVVPVVPVGSRHGAGPAVGSRSLVRRLVTSMAGDTVISHRAATKNGTATLLLATLFVLTLPSNPTAHDVPASVTIHAFVKPEGSRLHLVLRMPLTLLTDTSLPQRGPGYLALAYVEPVLEATIEEAAAAINLYENGHLLAPVGGGTARISLPSNRSFATYEEAIAHMGSSKLPEETNLFWNQGFFDAHLQYPIESDGSEFTMDMLTAFGIGDRLKTSVRFMPPGGPTRTYELIGQSGRVHLDPRWHQAAAVFVKVGFFHMLDGTDHLLFLFCLVIPFRRFRPLLLVVTAFTVAYSITLIMSAYEFGPTGSWFPPLVETLIAASILYMALENVVAANLRRRWLIAFAFGLVHGVGFSFGLRETLQFAGSHLEVSLLSFNVGVELGQVLALALAVPALVLLFRHVIAERLGTIILSVLVAHTGWHWITTRGEYLWQVGLPIPDAVLVATLARWMVLLMLAGWAVWFLAGQRWRRPATETSRSNTLRSPPPP